MRMQHTRILTALIAGVLAFASVGTASAELEQPDKCESALIQLGVGWEMTPPVSYQQAWAEAIGALYVPCSLDESVAPQAATASAAVVGDVCTAKDGVGEGSLVFVSGGTTINQTLPAAGSFEHGARHTILKSSSGAFGVEANSAGIGGVIFIGPVAIPGDTTTASGGCDALDADLNFELIGDLPISTPAAQIGCHASGSTALQGRSLSITSSAWLESASCKLKDAIAIG